MEGITSSTMRVVVSSRQVASWTPPVVVRVVMPRMGETAPATASRGVTPPWTSRSTSLSPYCSATPDRPGRAVPLRGTAGSLTAAIAAATAAAANIPGSFFPEASATSGPTSTIRSLLSSLARAFSSAAEALLMPTTASRSRRAEEAASTLSRSACCTVRSPLSQTTTCTSSTPCRAAKAAA